ncbi:hypothetical protein [Endozoicomonas montiporae]|nr:hypothetical protein [Endozoicomonas montiporae]AMO57545.1 hypothetical protein EZMO1_3564 [Endozoicomonas montiporae CL-33]
MIRTFLTVIAVCFSLNLLANKELDYPTGDNWEEQTAVDASEDASEDASRDVSEDASEDSFDPAGMFNDEESGINDYQDEQFDSGYEDEYYDESMSSDDDSEAYDDFEGEDDYSDPEGYEEE